MDLDAEEFKRMIRETEKELERRGAIVRRVLDAMPPPVKDVARLYYQDKLTEGEIANKLKLSQAKTHNVLKRARDMFQVGIALITGEDLKQFRDSASELEDSFQELDKGFKERFPDVDPDDAATDDRGEAGAK